MKITNNILKPAKTKVFTRAISIIILVLASAISYSEPVRIDRVIAIVDEDIIMESEFKEKVEYFRTDILQRTKQSPPESILQQQVLERLILESIQLQMAKRAGLRVDDNTLNKTIEKVAQQNKMSTEEFRQSIENEGQSYKNIREQIRRDLIISELRQKIIGRRIRITDQDIKTFMASDLGHHKTAATYRLGHILIAAPAQTRKDKTEKLLERTKKIRQAIIEGASFEEMAIQHSAGQNALEGGDLGWRNANQLPSLFSETIKAMPVGDISEPISSPSGFHLIKLIDKKGGASHLVNQTRVRHILIKPNEIRTLDEAKQLAEKLRKDIIAGEDFSDLARIFSEDPSSARNGGELDWVIPGSLVPEFEKTMNNNNLGKISKPFLTQYGWHILEVLERREKDMGKEFKINQARNFLSNQRYQEELEAWIREIRQEAYVDIKKDISSIN